MTGKESDSGARDGGGGGSRGSGVLVLIKSTYSGF